MTLLYTNPCFLDHKTGRHPERGERLEAVTAHLRTTGLDARCRRPACPPATVERIALVHHPLYVEVLKEFAEEGGGAIEADTILSRRSYDAAIRAVGAACDAVERLAAGDDTSALCLVRPPGHHARAMHAMGFCLLNNVAVAARVATRELGMDRVLIVDFDVHHCNGTQEIFWEDERVAVLSQHRYPFYPGTGWKDETGGGAARGTKVNLPVEFGMPRRDQLTWFEGELTRLADRIRPQLVLVSAGFDSHAADPVGSLGLETEDFEVYTRLCQEVADAYAGGRLVSLLEGGYHPQVLAECVGLHLRLLLERHAPTDERVEAPPPGLLPEGETA